MSVAAVAGEHTVEIGTPSFLKAFFSTVFAVLEAPGWGTRYPVLMRDFYQGRVAAALVATLADELSALRVALASHPPAAVVWDFERREARPPWGDAISSDITSLADYFVTSEGKNLLGELISLSEYASSRSLDVRIE